MRALRDERPEYGRFLLPEKEAYVTKKRMSLEERVEFIEYSILASLPEAPAGMAYEVEGVYETDAVVKLGEDLFVVEYAIDDNGEITIGELKPKEQPPEETPEPMPEEATLSLKVGSRNSAKDQERLQSIHDFAVENGAICTVKSLPLNTVKALGDGKVGGYLVRFTTDKDPDLTGEFFTAKTDFGDAQETPVYYHHGDDRTMGKRRIGKGNLKRDDVGVWVEAQLNMRDDYEKAIYQMAQEGKLGWSSGTAAHLVEIERQGKSNWIKSWPLGLDASLTPTPAEPRNNAQTTKGFDMEKDELKAIIEEAASKAVAEYQKSEPAQKTGANVQVITDETEQPFKSAGEYFTAVKMAGMYPRHEDVRLRSLKANGANETTPADGGYLVPPQYAAGIVERMYSTGAILSRVAQDPVTGNSLTYNAIDETSRADGSRYGGILGYWLAEAGTKQTSKPKFRQVELKLKKVAALCYATDELLEDVAALESWLNRTVPGELQFRVEDAIINGDGAAKPLGIMNSPALVTVTRETASKIQLVDVVNMWSRRWAGVNDYVWLINQDAVGQLWQMTVGSYTAAFMPPGGVSGQMYGTLFGAPVIETEYNASLNTTGDIMLASLSQYQTITKGGIQSASSIHVAFTTDETAFRFVYRVDGASLWNSALTPFKGSNTQSPFVVLGSASA